MDRRTIAVVFIALMASGCTLPGNSTDTGDNNGGPELATDRGLRIEAFRPTDETLRPSQPAILNLRLKNYHTNPIYIKEISIYNEGLLTVGNRSCNPSPGNLGSATGNTYPEMRCQWDVEAPPESAYGSFKSKPASVNLRLVYNSSLTNQRPFKVKFKPLEEINSTRSISKTFSNSEVSMKVSTESPVPVDSSRTVEIVTREVGKGRIASDTNYVFKFIPDNLFGEDCEREDAPVVDKELKFSCSINGASRGTRNLLFSTSYKYVKEPVLNIKLVNNQ
ncbi:MAG: hypothetical protein ABEK04_03500 [Candidatus Nanohalobium sp.]